MSDERRTTNCRACGTRLSAETAEIAVAPGRCPHCGTPVCFECGCTERHPCTQQCSDGVRACSWADDGLCSFCHMAQINEVYQAVSTGRGQIEPGRGLVLYGGQSA